MANRDAPFGFVPIGTTDGSDYHGKMQRVTFGAAANGFIGDFVADGTQLAADAYPRVEVAAAGAGDLVGAIVEFYPDFTDEGSLITNFAPSGTPREARVTHGTRVVYEAQADDDATVLDGEDIGALINLVATVAGDQVTGISGQELDSSTSTGSGGAGVQFAIRGFNEAQGNELGVANGRWNVVVADAQASVLIGG